MVPQPHPVQVWELPLRFFHWLLVLLVMALWLTAEWGMADRHAQLGYLLLTLVIFRILWGFVGGTHSRFSNFLVGPTRVLRYFQGLWRGQSETSIGHNPAGGWMVITLLLVLLLQALLGLGSTDEVLFEGPWYELVGEETSLTMTALHEANFNLLLALIGLHLSAILYYRLVKKEDLVLPMLHGKKFVPSEQAAAIRNRSIWSMPIFGLATMIVWGLLSLG
jgi:cytochrome b